MTGPRTSSFGMARADRLGDQVAEHIGGDARLILREVRLRSVRWVSAGFLADGRWTLSHGAPAATIWADDVDYLRALSGRNATPTSRPTETRGRQLQPPPPASYSDRH